jgi:hypothetical protein
MNINEKKEMDTVNQNQETIAVVLTSGMNDDELIGYCSFHCQSERALFNAEQINRMLILSGNPFRIANIPNGQWRSVHEEMEEMCSLARLNLSAKTIQENQASELGVTIFPKANNVFNLAEYRTRNI